MKMKVGLLGIAVVTSIFLPVNGFQGDPLTGTWDLEIKQLDHTWFHRIHLEITEGEVSGKSQWNRAIKGRVIGNRIEFTIASNGEKPWGEFWGTRMEDRIGGDCLLDDIKSTWTATRSVVMSGREPQTHRHSPKTYQRTLSSEATPVLKVYPGDTIVTTTLDSGGWDQDGKRLSLGGNPATGPFYVHSAMPGDTLVVKFKKVILNSDFARSGVSIIPRAVTPQYYRRQDSLHWSVRGHWQLDRVAGIATLKEVKGTDGQNLPLAGLADFTIDLAPMVGIVGVAPRDGAASTRNSGRHGGNLDYNGIKESTTVYLPVYHPGALLYVGDGHAAQGDGELSGNALETTLELEFEVDVIGGTSVRSPRVEDTDHIMVIGVHGSLDQALQEATSNLARWLTDYGLNSTEVALLLGTSMEYDIADLVGAQVGVVAKVEKKHLPK